MTRLLIFGIAALVIDIFAIVDLVVIERSRVRAFPKIVWVIVILILPVIGALLWFTVGRDWARQRSRESKIVAPDDDPAFLRGIQLDEEREQRIRKLEQELADLDDDPDTKK